MPVVAIVDAGVDAGRESCVVAIDPVVCISIVNVDDVLQGKV